MQIPQPHAKPLGNFIFFSRWLQAPLYLGLIIAQGVYVFRFVIELWHLVTHATDLSFKEEDIMLAVLTLIDIVMIANLLIMVIIGGYETFVSRIRIDGHPDQPEWLSHVNANVLKVKLAMAIIGISSIHLLKTFIEVGDLGAVGASSDNVTGDNYTGDGVFWQVMIHLVFIVSAVALAWIDKISGGAHLKPSDQGGMPGQAPSPSSSSPGGLSAFGVPSDADRAANETQAARFEELARELRGR